LIVGREAEHSLKSEGQTLLKHSLSAIEIVNRREQSEEPNLADKISRLKRRNH